MGVQLHVEIVGDSNLGVSGCHPVFDPFHEWVSHYGVYHITDVLARKFSHFSTHREVVDHPFVLSRKLDYIIQSQELILRNKYNLNFITENGL